MERLQFILILEAKRPICSPFFIWGSSLQKLCGFSIALALVTHPPHLDKSQMKSLYFASTWALGEALGSWEED